MSEEKKDASCPIQEAPLKIKKVTFWQQYRRKPLGMIGLAIVVIYVLGALAAPLITNYDPDQGPIPCGQPRRSVMDERPFSKV